LLLQLEFGQMNRFVMFAVFVAALPAAGCVGATRTGGDSLLEVHRQPGPLETKFFASDEDVQAGARHFTQGAFGLAQERFQAAVEKAPTDQVAWMGLAASYDRLRRFDLADRAYIQAEKIDPSNPSLYNNRGFSYLLRGDLVRARENLQRAAALRPNDATIANNLRLIDKSRRNVRRPAGAYL